MSGVQGTMPPELKTPTTYESVPGGENKTKTDLRSKEDQGMIQVEKEQDKVDDDNIAGRVGAGPAFVFAKDQEKQDPGVTGTG
ncbi:uncharacterized protein LOC108998328 [Juglans regia]|uniref:Uncharacterized protein LOC108998328 n=1 Tax=Juglans regia TaxID=51240 RepID=A0A2I4FFH5_JUGRE|nr:uncharacterized protein LOC108998328 [Juglans regia]